MQMTDNTEILTEGEIEQCRKEAEAAAARTADALAEVEEQDWLEDELGDTRRELVEESRSPGGTYSDAYKEHYDDLYKEEFEALVKFAREQKAANLAQELTAR